MGETERKKKLRRLRIFEYALAVALAGVMVSLYFIGRAKNMEPKKFSSKADLELPGKVFVSRFEDDKLRLVLKGHDLDYDQAPGQATLLNPEIEIYNDKGTVVVNAAKGSYLNPDGNILLKDGVVINFQKYQARTNSLIYNVKSEVAESEEEIEVSGKGLELKGKGYRFDLNKGEMEIKSAVKGKFKKKEG